MKIDIAVGQVWCDGFGTRFIIRAFGPEFVIVTNKHNNERSINRSALYQLVEDVKDFAVGQVWIDGVGDERTIEAINTAKCHGVFCTDGSSYTLTGRDFALNNSSNDLVRLVRLVSDLPTQSTNVTLEVESYTVEEIAAAYSQEFVERLRSNRLKS